MQIYLLHFLFIGEGSYLYRLLSRRYYRRIAHLRIAHLRIGDGFCHRVHGCALGAGAAAFVGHMVRLGREEEKPPFGNGLYKASWRLILRTDRQAVVEDINHRQPLAERYIAHGRLVRTDEGAH